MDGFDYNPKEPKKLLEHVNYYKHYYNTDQDPKVYFLNKERKNRYVRKW